MNRLRLYIELRHHRRLAEKRALNFSENQVAKWIVIISSSIMVVYLMGFALMFSLLVNSDRTIMPVEFMTALAPYLLTIDFLIRFLAQQTPAQLMKPYLLLPIPRHACIESFVLSSMLSWGNLVWFWLLVPYTIMSVVFSEGIAVSLNFLLFYWLLIVANSQWYAIVRTLINKSMLYWAVPLLFYALVFMPVILQAGKAEGWENMFELYGLMGTAVNNANPLALLGAIVLVCLLAFVNRQVQYHHIFAELSKSETTTLHHVTQMNFLERFGEMGTYLQIEVKSLLRNKNPRKSFIFATSIILLLTVLMLFTEVYDNPYMKSFWCIYNYLIYGSMMLLKVMSYEGNYIDQLMVHRENILRLLHAKYIFYSVLLVVPFLLMLPLVANGKWSMLMLVSYGIFTAGFQYFVLFQMAVYNKTTLPLNAKLMSKNGLENNYVQVIAQLGTLAVPLLFVNLIQHLCGETVSYMLMLTIGGALIALHRLWLRNIYNRMMKKKYVLIEGWHTSR